MTSDSGEVTTRGHKSPGLGDRPASLPLERSEPLVLGTPPGLLTIIARAAWRAPMRAQGVLGEGASVPELRVQRRGVRVGASRVVLFRSVCQVAGPDSLLPLSMPEVLFFGLLGRLATDGRFPLSPFGLIHVAQTIAGHRPVAIDRPYDLEAKLAAARRTEKGTELDLRLTVAEHGELMWEAVTTLLSRAPSARTGKRPGESRSWSAPEGSVELEVAADTGRAYARVSGDWSPHHLWPVTARPLGYRRPIVHGMWTLSRLIGLLPAEVDTTLGTVGASFHRPLLLPATIVARVVSEGGAWTLDATSPERGSPHVRGTFRS